MLDGTPRIFATLIWKVICIYHGLLLLNPFSMPRRHFYMAASRPINGTCLICVAPYVVLGHHCAAPIVRRVNISNNLFLSPFCTEQRPG